MQAEPCLALYTEMVGDINRRFGEQTMMFQELSTYGHEMGVDVVVVTPGFTRTRQGWRFHAVKSAWELNQGVQADIVIRRSGTFRRYKRNLIDRELAQLRTIGILHTLPRSCSNKWVLFRTLSGIQAVQSHLPHTELATTAEQVYRVVQRRRDVYVKPLSGAQGVSIYRLCSLPSAGIRAVWEQRIVPRTTERRTRTFHPETKIIERTFTNYKQFNAFWLTTKLQRCVVQDTISLPTLHDREPCDFRWLIQFSDRPQVIARVARIGQSSAVTTNIHTGGRALSAEKVLSEIRPTSKEDLLKQMDDVALTIAAALAKRYGPYAELGIDLAIDKHGSIFVFEVNPTPGRRMLRSLPTNTRELSLRAMIEYAIRATGFQGA